VAQVLFLYLCAVFIRKKKNRSGSFSIIIVDKSGGKYNEIHSIGTGTTTSEINALMQEGHKWLYSHLYGNSDLFTPSPEKVKADNIDKIEQFLSNVDCVLLNGVELILDRVYKRVGFDKIDDEILRQLVISRMCQPSSKSGTVDYLLHYFDEDVNLSKIYRYLDKLNDIQKDAVQEISVKHTAAVLGGRIGVVFYDVTTLYFESDKGDDLRISGFSKDGKHSQPQIVLGLLVSTGGYPLAYSIHKGNQYEGTTMLPVVEEFVKKFNLDDFVVVADSGLMNACNIAELEENGYKYIIGARIKNESKEIKEWILSLEKINGSFYERNKTDKCRLIVGYSDNRAKKDRYNRDKGVRRLEKAYRRGYLTKENINKRGYNKFLKIENNVEVKIDLSKIEEDAKWDGLKGYITNTELPADVIYEQYRDL
jgi:hypothetical protein